jgi:hypothetical protein
VTGVQTCALPISLREALECQRRQGCIRCSSCSQPTIFAVHQSSTERTPQPANVSPTGDEAAQAPASLNPSCTRNNAITNMTALETSKVVRGSCGGRRTATAHAQDLRHLWCQRFLLNRAMHRPLMSEQTIGPSSTTVSSANPRDGRCSGKSSTQKPTGKRSDAGSH